MAENKAKDRPMLLLTKKQIETLELLVKHKTSKEISRELGISPHTVDQRIESAKRRFGVTSRSQLAQAYLDQKRLCHPLTYEESHIARAPLSIQSIQRDKGDAPVMFVTQVDREESHLITTSPRARIVPALFEGPKGTLHRILAIMGSAALLALTILAVITIYIEISAVVN
jgi:DNA-binding CsgD family transcriptional regulator